MRRKRGEKGAAAVEFALVLPILIMLFMGMVEFGLAVGRYASLSNAAREGVREASLGATSAEVSATVKSYLSLGGSDTVTVSVTCQKPDGSPCGTFDSDKASGGIAIVTARVSQGWVTPIGATFGENLQLSKTSEMRIE